MNEDQTIKVFCLLFSILGIFVLAYFSTNYKPRYVEIHEITYSLEGRRISTSGYIQKTYRSKKNPDYLLIVLSDNKSEVFVPLFSNLIKELRSNDVSLDDFYVGRWIEVFGTVSEYKGNLQIIPRKFEDIRFEND